MMNKEIKLIVLPVVVISLKWGLELLFLGGEKGNYQLLAFLCHQWFFSLLELFIHCLCHLYNGNVQFNCEGNVRLGMVRKHKMGSVFCVVKGRGLGLILSWPTFQRWDWKGLLCCQSEFFFEHNCCKILLSSFMAFARAIPGDVTWPYLP